MYMYSLALRTRSFLITKTPEKYSVQNLCCVAPNWSEIHADSIRAALCLTPFTD